MIGKKRKSIVRPVGFVFAALVFALASAESKACNSSRHDAGRGAQSSETRAAKAHKFLWPAPGRIVVSLCGLRSEGIDLAIADRAPIRAADAGVVAYAGDDLKGYGNVIIIRHDGGFVSAYAHVPNPKVSRGDQVSRGQVIGTAAARQMDGPLLHFELRRGTKIVDAERYLEGRRAPPGH
jgi:lipoprotein NlpD